MHVVHVVAGWVMHVLPPNDSQAQHALLQPF